MQPEKEPLPCNARFANSRLSASSRRTNMPLLFVMPTLFRLATHSLFHGGISLLSSIPRQMKGKRCWNCWIGLKQIWRAVHLLLSNSITLLNRLKNTASEQKRRGYTALQIGMIRKTGNHMHTTLALMMALPQGKPCRICISI